MLTAEDVIEANPQFSNNVPGFSFWLSPAAGAVFADLTSRHIGKMLTLTVCGDELVTATLRSRLAGGGYVALDSLGSAVYYADRMTGERPCK